MKLITIIIPVYKIKEEFLRKCIESIINQNCKLIEVILVDDGSPDNCGEICDEYGSRFNFIKVIHKKNEGVSIARNVAIALVKTPWLAFVDADDWISSDYIKSLSKILVDKDVNNSDIIMFDYTREYKDSKSLESMGIKEGYLGEKDLEECCKALFYKYIQGIKFNPYTIIGLWDKVYSTNFIKTNDLKFVPEAKKGQDRIFNAEAINRARNIYYIKKNLYHYRCWQNSRTNRFDENIPYLTEIEVSKLLEIIQKYDLGKEARECLTCRICTRLYTCMRLYYFHISNPKNFKEKIEDIKTLVSNSYYKKALEDVNMKMLNFQEKIFVKCMKLKLYRVLYILVRLKSAATTKKLR